MKMLLPVALCAAAGLVASCSTEPSDATPTTSTVTITQSSEPSTSPADAPEPTSSTFDDVLANPGAYAHKSQDEYFTPNGKYSYFLTDVNADGEEDLLLRVDGEAFAPVTVILNDGGEPAVAEGYMVNGVASAGGSRAYMYASASGQGVYEIMAHSIQQDWTSNRYEVKGGKLEKVESQGIGYDERLPDYREIEWRDTGTNAAAAQASPQGQGADSSESTSPTVSGTFRTITAGEYINNYSTADRTPNGESEDEQYLMLFFDQPQSMTGSKAGEYVTETVDYAFIERPGDTWSAYEGQSVTVSYDPSKLAYPSDTGMPLGALRMGDALLDVQ